MSERDEWEALATSETLHMLPPEALIASIKYLAGRLLELSPNATVPRAASYGQLSDDELTDIIDAWRYKDDRGTSHVPGCSLTFDGYCLDCHADAWNALEEWKRRHPENL